MTSDFAAAAAEAETRIARGERDPHLVNLVAWHRADGGDLPAALALLDEVLARDPAEPETLVSKAALLRRQGQLRDAVLHCDAAIRAAPGYPEAWLERGFVLAAGGSMAAAGACYRRVLDLAPGHAAAHAGLAGLAARDGALAEGRAHAAAALAAQPGNVIAATALATIELESGDPGRARDLVAPLVAAMAAPSADRSVALGLLGDALDKLDRPAAAYEAYARSKQDFATIHDARFAGRASHRAFVETILAGIDAIAGGLPSTAGTPANAAARHLFLLGYPRSGTTLVENVLASHPEVAALEERPTMAMADLAFLAEPGGLARFAALRDEALEPYRRAYWDKVAGAGLTVAGKCFVDMDPLKGTRLPLIARLFPEARIVVMRRDPRDVVWSCFRTNFALTNVALEFTTLEGAARHYDAMMRLTEAALARFDLAAHVVAYHRLVEDFDRTTQDLCAFAGLPWSEALRDFAGTARRRGVATASAGQVRKGLYDGTRQWERYAEQLAPVLPILAPWIEKFGYAP